jgi:hypothetical protein
VLREKVRRRERSIHLGILMSCLYKNLTIRKDYGVPSFVNEFWRFYSSHLQLLLFSCFFLVSRCRVVHLFLVFVVVCSISWLVFINCVVMYLFVCFTSNTAVNENENVFIRIFANQIQASFHRFMYFYFEVVHPAGPPFASRASLPPF